MQHSIETQNTKTIDEYIQSAKNIRLPTKRHTIAQIFNDCDIQLSFEEYKKLITQYKIHPWSDINTELLKLIPKTRENIANIKNYSLYHNITPNNLVNQCLFPCKTKGSKVLEEILDKTQNNSTIYDAMKEIVTSFINSRKHSSLNIEQSQFLQRAYDCSSLKEGIPINLYIRYGHVMDYPEIAELLAIFLDIMTQSENFTFFSHVKIIPRFSDAYKPKQLLSNLTNTSFFDVKGEDFEKAINSGITIFCSHSDNNAELPHIISESMEKNKKSYCSPIECEEVHNRTAYKPTSAYSSQEILEIYYKILQKIEKDMQNQLPGNNIFQRIGNIFNK